jgi:magnesium-transporting ATPase (P-type)
VRFGAPALPAYGLFRNPFLWLAVLVVVFLQLSAAYFSPLAAILDTTRPSLTDWVVICSSGLLAIGVVEMVKLKRRSHVE